ncbi:MAG: hypothetical protein NZ585_15030, partial [Chloracidobacterium sp.]|nr:hypothetical protein [Chloracidobacterium sp.]
RAISLLAPTADLRHALHQSRDCPALNLIEELLHYFATGQWLPEERSIRTTCLLVLGEEGVPAKLLQQRVAASDAVGLTPGYYPHPELLLTARVEESFAAQFERACKVGGAPPFAIRWNFEPYRNAGNVWQDSILIGSSLGAAVGVGLHCLLDASAPPPDSDYALTGALLENGHLTSVGGYRFKADTFNRFPTLRLVLP